MRKVMLMLSLMIAMVCSVSVQASTSTPLIGVEVNQLDVDVGILNLKVDKTISYKATLNRHSIYKQSSLYYIALVTSNTLICWDKPAIKEDSITANPIRAVFSNSNNLVNSHYFYEHYSLISSDRKELLRLNYFS